MPNKTNRAFHTNWTMSDYSNEKSDLDILLTVLSAIFWKKYNGPIKLYTDSAGAKYYSYLGIDKIYDLGVDVRTLDGLYKSVDPNLFAAGKIYALEEEPLGSISIDRDLIAGKRINHSEEASAIMGNKINFQSNNLPFYNSNEKNFFGYNKNHRYIDYSAEPYDVFIFAIFNQELKNEYLKEFKRFIKTDFDIKQKSDYRGIMFAGEGCMFSMIAKMFHMYKKIENHSIDSTINFEEGLLTHVGKEQIKIESNESRNTKHCVKILNLIRRTDEKTYKTLTEKTSKFKYYKKIIDGELQIRGQ